MEKLQEITIDEIVDSYTVLLIDAYGVLVHTSGAIHGAIELINELNNSNKQYYVLTNDASKLPTTAAERYQGYGLALEPERIISSGTLLKSYFRTNNLIGARCVVFGPDDSVRYVELAGGQIVSCNDVFDVLVIGDEAGFPFLETIDMTLSSLFRKIDNKEDVHLILPNPDLIYPKADQNFGFASGSIALMFEAALNLRYPELSNLRFVRLGKPHPPIFTEALKRSGSKDMIMIGDQLETDIRGANAFGIDSALITGGVSASGMTFLTEDLRPTYIMHSLMSRSGAGS
jgi:HAD superfamily hydrolase (TIGR01450 family)